jgi:hypothetical protein
MNTYVKAQANFFDDTITQEVIKSDLSLQELYEKVYMYCFEATPPPNSINEILKEFFNVDLLLSIIKI